MKRCTKCGLEKPRDEFYAFNNGRGRYLRGDCKVCYTAYVREFRKENPRRCKDWDYRAAYDLSLSEVEALAASQDFKCLICGEVKKLVVDHCHVSGEIRGLLCNECNMGLGRFDDSVERLQAAVKYLRASSSIRRAPALQAGGTRSEAGEVHQSSGSSSKGRKAVSLTVNARSSRAGPAKLGGTINPLRCPSPKGCDTASHGSRRGSIGGEAGKPAE